MTVSGNPGDDLVFRAGLRGGADKLTGVLLGDTLDKSMVGKNSMGCCFLFLSSLRTKNFPRSLSPINLS